MYMYEYPFEQLYTYTGFHLAAGVAAGYDICITGPERALGLGWLMS